MVIADWLSIVESAPAAFLFGLLVGWVVSQKYAIIQRPQPHDRRKTDQSDSADDEHSDDES